MTKPHVLLIDDKPEATNLSNDIHVIPLNPLDHGFEKNLVENLAGADLVLLDQNLELDQKLTLAVRDGASFVGTLRSWARSADHPLPPLVIYTNQDEAFADEVPAVGAAVPLNGSFVGREARIAPALDVEWLINKDDDHAAAHVSSLAQAAQKLREVAGSDARISFNEAVAFLGLPTDVAWRNNALENIIKWTPPISEIGAVASNARGTTPVLKWLLHKVLPYPGLLVSDGYAAWSLGIELNDFQSLVGNQSEQPWVIELGQSIYRGAAHDLCQRRWWAAGIDMAGWKLREKGYDLNDFHAALETLAVPGLRSVPQDLVVVINADLEEVGLASVEETQRLYPPGWPKEALDPWIRRDEVDRDEVARAMTDQNER
jgi:hypothetical protein